jgi:hypothetical protein
MEEKNIKKSQNIKNLYLKWASEKSLSNLPETLEILAIEDLYFHEELKNNINLPITLKSLYIGSIEDANINKYITDYNKVFDKIPFGCKVYLHRTSQSNNGILQIMDKIKSKKFYTSLYIKINDELLYERIHQKYDTEYKFYYFNTYYDSDSE